MPVCPEREKGERERGGESERPIIAMPDLMRDMTSIGHIHILSMELVAKVEATFHFLFRDVEERNVHLEIFVSD